MDELIYTRLILRNDSTTAWLENKDQVLLKGEVGIEFLTDGTVKMKIGDGIKTWEQLDYFGGEDAHIYEATVEKDADHIAAITTVVAGKKLSTHDVAIVKEGLIAADKLAEDQAQMYQHTAYRWNGTAWAAFDGNYGADNVFTTAPITLAGNYTSIGNWSKGKTIAAGTSLQSVLSGMLQTVLQPSVTQPTAVITASGSDYDKEVGTSYTKPTATLTVTTGSYTYGPATGVTFPIWSETATEFTGVKLAFGADPDAEGVVANTNSAALTNNQTITLAASTYAPNATTALYTDNQVGYTFSGKAKHSDGAVAKDNLGDASNPEKKITANALTVADKTVNFRGFRYMYAGGTTAATVDSAAIRALAAKRKNNSKPSTSSYFEFKGTKGDTKVIFSFPAAMTTGTPKFEIFTMAWGSTGGFVEESVQVADARENDGYTAYRTFVYTPATPLAADETKYRVYF